MALGYICQNNVIIGPPLYAVTIMLHSDSSGSIESAAEHVSRAWFPINKPFLEEIRNSIIGDKYNKRIDPLLLDLKGDLSLYLLCLKKLASLADQSSKTEGETLTPPKVFRQAGYEKITELLMSEIESEVLHRFDNLSDLQAARLKEGMISASATEIMAQDSDLDPELGFSCALLRQLGLTLIAWNYPHVYSRAMQSLSEDSTDLENNIKKILGFSPSTLALTIASKWGLAPSITRVISRDENQASTADDNSSKSILILEKLCKVGEALARASDPDNYPTALKDWESAESAIKSILGSDGIVIIQSRVEENLRAYTDKLPQTFKIDISTNLREKITNSNYAKVLLEQNRYVESCPPLLKLQIKELYSTLSADEISRESIQMLTTEIFPGAGFDCGCIFMFEPSTTTLVPMLKFGGISESIAKTIPVSSMNLDSNPVATAYRCTTPIKQTYKTIDDKNITTLSGSIGNEQKTGVLYVEVSERLSAKSKGDPELYFKALRLCLSHALGLK